MQTSLKISLFAAAGLSLFAGAGVVNAASPVANFGPGVSGDASLMTNLGALSDVVAWQNSPQGDVYQMALAAPAPEMPFESVAMESSSPDALAAGPEIFNGPSLNANMRSLNQVIAWRKSPEGDAFAYALADHLKVADFQSVALASVPTGGLEASGD